MNSAKPEPSPKEAEAVPVQFLRLGTGLLVIALAFFATMLSIAHPSGAAVDQRALRIAKAAAGGFSDAAFQAATAEMDPAMIALARRYDPTVLREANLTILPPQMNPMVQGAVSLQEAKSINAALPFSSSPNPAARAFSLKAAAALDQERALECLTQAVYYEAAFEPEDGLRAVAQVVINRLRHPAFPKTVCGVVYQGSNRITGCQFSFTCDGALSRPPVAWAWERARKVARAALYGHVMKEVGGATHYHTDYVAPYWAPRLYKVQKIGAHIFYRWPGSWGLPGAFNGRYAGLERPGVDPAGDPNALDLDSLMLAGLEGAARQAHAGQTTVAVLDLPGPQAPAAAPTISEEVIAAATAAPEPPVKLAVVVVPPIRPKAPPRLALPN